MNDHSSRFRLRAARLLALCGLLLWLGCGSSSPSEPGNGRPAWLSRLTATIQSEPVTNPPSAIFSYRYQGKTVYYRTAYCCDFPSTLYDADGVVLCRPDGGLAGGTDPQCPDFLTSRTDETLIWRDPRGGAR